jgi:threonine dehydrogenase-like Zn-dependent dehydrogenase
MKAVVKTAPKDGAIEVTDRPLPAAGPGEVVIKVEATGICGTDRHIWHWDPSVQFIKPPVIFGHEFCGRVHELGKDVTGGAAGQGTLREATTSRPRCTSSAAPATSAAPGAGTSARRRRSTGCTTTAASPTT